MQHLRKYVRPAHVSCEEQNAESIIKILPRVLRCLLGGTGVGGQLLCLYARHAPRRQGVAAGGEGVRHIYGAAAHALEHRVLGKTEVLSLREHAPGGDKLLHVVRYLRGIVLRPVHKAPGLVENYGRALGNVIERTGALAVDEGLVPVGGAQFGPGGEALCVLTQRLGQTSGAFALCAGGQLFKLRGQRGGPSLTQ